MSCYTTHWGLFCSCDIEALMEKCFAVFSVSALPHASSAFNSSNLKIMCFTESILIIYQHLAQFGSPAQTLSKRCETKVLQPSILFGGKKCIPVAGWRKWKGMRHACTYAGLSITASPMSFICPHRTKPVWHKLLLTSHNFLPGEEGEASIDLTLCLYARNRK